MLRPGIVPLRPLSLGEIYDGAFQALRANPRAMLGVTAVVVTVISLIDVATTLLAADGLAAVFSLTEPGREITSADVDTLLGSAEVLGVGAAVSTLAWVVGLAVVTGLLTVAVSQAVLGRRVTLDQLWRRTRPRLLPLIGVALLFMLLMLSALLLPILLVAVALIVSPAAGVVVFVVALPTLFAGWGLVLGRLSLVPPILLLEEQRLFAAFARSWRLTRGSSWRVLGIVLLTLVIVLVTGALVSAPFTGVSIAISVTAGEADVAAALGLSAPQLVIAAVGDIVSRTIVYPFFAGAVALLYIDLRMRREGLDVQLARAAAEGPPPDGPNSA